jgi:hypothetical protein
LAISSTGRANARFLLSSKTVTAILRDGRSAFEEAILLGTTAAQRRERSQPRKFVAEEVIADLRKRTVNELTFLATAPRFEKTV